MENMYRNEMDYYMACDIRRDIIKGITSKNKDLNIIQLKHGTLFTIRQNIIKSISTNRRYIITNSLFNDGNDYSHSYLDFPIHGEQHFAIGDYCTLYINKGSIFITKMPYRLPFLSSDFDGDIIKISHLDELKQTNEFISYHDFIKFRDLQVSKCMSFIENNL
jgi:hypothetical protein